MRRSFRSPISACWARSAERAKLLPRQRGCCHSQPTPIASNSWLAQLHAPTGIDLGADTPASIALSILAEIQQTLNAATALPLRQVRAAQRWL